MTEVLTIYRVENGWLMAVGSVDQAKPPSRRMIAANPAGVGRLAGAWAAEHPPARPLLPELPSEPLELGDNFRFPPPPPKP